MNIPIQNCSSCGACANICVHGAITMRLDKEGFYRPFIDKEKCIKCGACEKVCPWNKSIINPNNAEYNPKTIAAYAKDENIRTRSSSGGIFSVLAEKILDEGGAVVGVAQLGTIDIGHIVVDNRSDLARLRGSKYVQANVGFIYREVRDLLKKKRKVLFSGTPCQVAGLYAVLGDLRSSENLVTVDIVCHGTPSVKLLKKYVIDIEKKFHKNIDHITFREKNTGWKSYSLKHCFNEGDSIIVPHGQSKYMDLFLSRICQNTSCDACHYRRLPRIADITLGDYWGISKYHPEMDDDKGTSVVLLNTEHGKILFESVAINLIYCDSKVEYAIEGNPCIVRSSKRHPKRAEFFTNLDDCSFDFLTKTYCSKQSIWQHIFSRLSRIIYSFIKKLNKFFSEL